MKDRLRQFLAAENISQAQFADTLNVVRASVSHILSGRNNPSFDFIKALMLHYPSLNVEWLMFGKGKMYKEAANTEQAPLAAEPPVSYPVQDLLFPETDDEPAPEVREINEVPNQSPSVASSNEINTSNTQIQTIINQRKVAKIIVLFDDGSYQEM